MRRKILLSSPLGLPLPQIRLPQLVQQDKTFVGGCNRYLVRNLCGQ